MHAPTIPAQARAPGHPFYAALAAPLLAGASFKHEHLDAILADDDLAGGFFEVHAENYMGAGGPPHRMLTAVRERYPVSLHGVGMSIGGADGLDERHLERFRDLVLRYQPALVSEHLAWSSHAGTFFNDLLPLSYNKATLDQVCAHIEQVQEAIRRPLLIENPATYLAFATSSMSEVDFIGSMAQRTGCGLLLDINNVVVSAANHGACATTYLAQFPLAHVAEIHLAGHSEQLDDEGARLLIDSHDCAVDETVWNLYRAVVARLGTTPTLIEWDSKVPAWELLRGHVLTASRIMAGHGRPSAEALDHG